MKIKNILALLLSVLMLITLLPLSAAAEEIEIVSIEELEPAEEEQIPAATVREPAASVVSRTIRDTYVNPLYTDLAEAEAVETMAVRNEEDPPIVIYEECEGMDGLAAILRREMVLRSDTVYFLMHADEALDVTVKDLATAACAHTGAPKQGDYLLIHFVSGNLSCAEIPTSTGYDYEGQIQLRYLTTEDEESAVDTAVASLLGGLNLGGLSEQETVLRIYDYVCGHTVLDSSGDDETNTAYSALIGGSGSARGFSVLMYRLLLEAGVDCRVILGRANAQDHAWNIARIGELYYNADAALDAGGTSRAWLLKGSESFTGHTRNREYSLLSFTRQYPMGTEDIDLDALLNKPEISKNPKSVTAYVGDTAEFTVKAGGSGLSYQWYFRKSSSGSWSKCSGSGAQSDTISIEAKSYRDGYQYRCQVKNAAGSVYSNTAKLTVKEQIKPEIETQPLDQSVSTGETAIFSVQAVGGGLSYQWYFRKTADGSWSKCSGDEAATASFSVEAKAYRSGYQYRCLVRNSLGSTYSEAASLLLLPTITAQPKDVNAAPGETVSLTVKASGDGLSYQWYFCKPGTDSWSKCSGDSAVTASLSVEAKSYRDGYRYRCAVSNAAGSVNSAAAVLSVAAAPAITKQPAAASAAIGETAVFTVQASGDGLSYQWQFRKNDTDSWTKCSGDSAVTASLSVEVKSYRNGYQYRCKVSNSVGSVTSEAAVLKALPVVTGQPQDVTAALGETAVFTVTVGGVSPSYQWQFRKSETDSWTNCSGDSAVTASLSVEAKSYRSGYQYRCKITDVNGSVISAAATLTVN